MENPIPEDVSTGARLNGPGRNSRLSPRYGKQLSTRPTTLNAESLELIRALAVIQDGLRQFVMAGGMLRTPFVNEKGIMVLAIKVRGHDLGVGPDGNFILDGKSVMEERTE